MPELEVTKKTCMECGTKSDPLVLVCPSCTSVLPDGDLPKRIYAAYNFPEDASELKNLEDDDISRYTPRIPVVRIVLFFVALSAVIAVVSWCRDSLSHV